MANPKKPQPTISTYRPGIVERVTDSTIGASLRQIHRLSGKSERDANRLAGDAMRNIEDLTGLKAAERSARQILKGKGGASDYATIGAAALPIVGGKIAKQVVKRANVPSTPSVNNQMYYESLRDLMKGKNYKPSDVLPKYGQRNITSAAELDDIARSGYVRPPPKTRSGRPNKYFTMTDTEVPSAANSRVKPVIRVPSDRIPEGSPVRRSDVQLWNNATQSWKPIPRKANGGEIMKPVKKAAGGAAKVRKGMATPEGKIIDAMNKIRGK